MATTERRRRVHLSVGQRLTAAVALLTATALAIVGVVLYAVESRNLDQRIERELVQEVSEFRGLAEAGVDPDTGEPFASADRLLRLFLERNEPGAEETLFAFTIEGPVLYQGQADARLGESDAFTAAVEELAADGGMRTLEIDATRYRLLVLPVQEGDQQGAFVVTHNVTGSRAELNGLLTTYAITAVMATLMIAAVSSLVAGRLLRPVHELRTTAQSITDGALDRRLDVTGNDDLAELQRTFNDMLDRLEAAFATQRQFLDDAGHELRTPLTVLRGHLEVLDTADRRDVEETRALLLDEIQRMARLVDELLMLASARRPDFVRPEDVDVPRLLDDVLAKARALGPRRWRVEPVAPATVRADPQRLTQALLQLADNATRHTTEEDEIVLGADVTDTTVELWVRDTGPGVPAEVRERVFDRFTQAREDGQGFGLGLAIVSAIAKAHDGTVVLDDTASGASFRLRLPGGNQ